MLINPPQFPKNTVVPRAAARPESDVWLAALQVVQKAPKENAPTATMNAAAYRAIGLRVAQ